MNPIPAGLLVRVRWIVRSALAGLRTTPWNSLAALLTIAVTLVLAAGFVLLLRNLHGLIERVGEDVRVTAYLAADLDETAARELAGRLAETPGVASVEYVSPDDARRRFARADSERAAMLEALDDNPLPASLELALLPASRTATGAQAVAVALRGEPGIEDVVHEQDWIDGYGRALGLLRTAGATLGGVLAAATLLIVANTVRLALFARRHEIEILSLVGASRGFIVWPHLLEGLLQGIAGGFVSWLVVAAAFRFFEPSLSAGAASLAGPLALRFLSASECVVLVGAGALLGGVGAGLSLIAGWRE